MSLLKEKRQFVKFPQKAQVSLITHFKCCHKFPVRVTDREDNLGPYSAKEELGRLLTKRTERTRNLQIQFPLLVIRILPSSSKYDLAIFLEHSKATFLSSHFLTFAFVHHSLKIDIWLPVFFQITE